MKILYIAGSMPPLRCGVGFYTNRLLDYLTPGFDLLTTTGMDSHKSANKTFYTPDWKLRRLFNLYRICKQGNYDVIHIQYPAKGYERNLGINKLPYLLRLLTKSKVVITLHEYHGSGFLGKLRNIITTLPANKIFVSNPYDLKSLPWFISGKTVIVPIGSSVPVAKRNTAKFNDIIKKAGFDKNKNTVVYFGYPYPNKGVDLAIEAAKQGGFQLLLLTEFDKNDDYQQGLSSRVKQAVSSGAKIHVTGFLKDKEFSEVMQECDYFLLPQPLPITAKSSTTITAATHKLLIISTAADNPRLNLPYINNKNALLIKPMTAENIISALNQDLGKHEIEQSLKKLAEYFNWEDIAKLHNEYYKEVTS